MRRFRTTRYVFFGVLDSPADLASTWNGNFKRLRKTRLSRWASLRLRIITKGVHHFSQEALSTKLSRERVGEELNKMMKGLDSILGFGSPIDIHICSRLRPPSRYPAHKRSFPAFISFLHATVYHIHVLLSTWSILLVSVGGHDSTHSTPPSNVSSSPTNPPNSAILSRYRPLFDCSLVSRGCFDPIQGCHVLGCQAKAPSCRGSSHP